MDDWSVRINPQMLNTRFAALCCHDDKTIILNAYFIELMTDEEAKNTVRHEIAHGIVGPGHAHDEIWQTKALEIGCLYARPCANFNIPEHLIDAIRSGADVLVETVEEITYRPKYTVTRIQDKCKYCGKVAKEVSNHLVVNTDEKRPNLMFVKLECGHTLTKLIPKGTPFHTLVSNLDKVKDCKHNFVKNQCMNCGEYKPYDFQIEGMKFIEKALATNKGACIFDEQGLGKTVQVDGYLRYAQPDTTFPVLFVLKSGLKFQQFKEILRWMGNIYVAQIISSGSDIVIPGLKCYIISYDMMTPKTRTSKVTGKTKTSGFDPQKFIDAGIKTLILDECQQIKNPDSTRTQMVRKLAKHMNVIATSGTPWKNRGSELFTVLNMIAPTKFPSYEGFVKQWVATYWHGNKLKEGGIRNIERFREYTKDIVIRRERAEVMKELPLVNRVAEFVELNAYEQSAYDDEVSDFVKWWNGVLVEEEENNFATQTNLLARIARMRHITGLAKIPATVEKVKEFIEETDRKMCVFVHHKDVGELLMREFKFMSERAENGDGVPVIQLHSGLSSEERFAVQEKFNNTPRIIMVASTLASGEGLNLQTASDCIMHERQWNPANEEQAEGRFIRIGQTAETVTATYMLAAETIDDFMHQLVEQKRIQFHNTMNKGEMVIWKQGDLIKDLAEAIVKNYEKSNKIKKMAQK